MPGSFAGDQPLFAFIDPFGATGAPFAAVRALLGSPKSEVLINFDADGVVRILRAEDGANRDALLTTVYGDESWRAILAASGSFRDQCVAAVELYKDHLRRLPGVRYVFSFEMLTSRRKVGNVGYFLVFAGQHRTALVKMKEAMWKMDQDGSHQFSNARVGQVAMFRYDAPADHSPILAAHFAGRQNVSYDEIWDFALNETPFPNPKSMLQVLENQGLITVSSSDPKRRKGTFKEGKILSIDFVEDGRDG